MAATLRRTSSGGIISVIITKMITNEKVTRKGFVIVSARMVYEASVNGGFQTVVRVVGERNSATPFYLNFTPCLPQFCLMLTSF